MNRNLAEKWDVVARHYYSDFHKTTRNFDAVTDRYASKWLEGICLEGSLLDLGGGRGRLKRICRNRTPKHTLVGDISGEMLRLARREQGGDYFVRMSAYQLPFKDHTIGLVGAFLCDPYASSEAFREVYTVLGVGGYFIFALPNKIWGLALREALGVNTQEMLFPDPCGDSVVLPSFLYFESELEDLLRRSGFERVRLASYGCRGIIEESDLSPHILLPAQRIGVHPLDLPVVTIGCAQKG
jgi:SAM-dependent methyltransferase